MERIKLGVVGLGQRGYSMLRNFLSQPEVDIVAICDVYEDRVNAAYDRIMALRENSSVTKYTDFEKFIHDAQINAIYVASSWEEHINQAIRAMEMHIPVGMEVGGAYSIKDCWRMVKTYEKTKTPIMLMENCCYDRFELLALSLARKGILGEIVHAHGAYSHDLRAEITGGNVNRHYRLRNYIARNCENYPTHEFGPIAKILNIGNGNNVLSVSSISSKARGLHEYANDERCVDKSLKDTVFNQGDVVSTNIICENGETVTLTLNTTLPAYYSREFLIRGTKGFVNQETNSVVLDGKIAEYWEPRLSVAKYLNNADEFNEYLPDNWRTITDEERALGHGGMDYFMCRDFVTHLLSGEPMPIDVYDAAVWYAITPLSAMSIAHGGKPYKMPNFAKNRK